MSSTTTWLLAVPWLVPLLGIRRLARREPLLRNAPIASGTAVSIIVPARNETVTIDTIVPSLLTSTYPHLEILIVDDRSTDDTAEKILAWTLRDSRVRLFRGTEPPPGWLGKPGACAQGAEHSTGDILLFTDSDTTHSPALVGHAVGALQSEKIDLLTVTTQLACLTFWERLVMPQVFALLGLRYTPQRVNSATQPWDVVANGQFIMMPRLSYQELGGHAAVSGQVVEDLALAQLCIRRKKKLRLYHAEELISTRMYRSLPELVEGWSKNLHLGARESMPPGMMRTLAPFGVVAAFIFWLIPFGLVFNSSTTAVGLVATVASLGFWALMTVGMRIPVWYAVLYPLGAVAALAIVIRSIWRGKRRVVWRGRHYQIAEKELD